MKFFRKLKLKKIVGALLTAFVLATAVTPFAQNVLAVSGTTGTIAMSNSTGGAMIHDADGNYTRVNGKYVRTNAGECVPVYCVEHGTHLSNGDTVNKSEILGTDANGNTRGVTVTMQNGQDHALTQAEIREIGYIYLCGYNGYNNWGETTPEAIQAIGDADLTNANFQKYIATQILIWEITEPKGHTLYCDNDAVQRNINIIRSRIEVYKAFLNDNGSLTAPAVAGTYNIIEDSTYVMPHSTAAGARADIHSSGDRRSDNLYHFNGSAGIKYPSYINPDNSHISSSTNSPVVGKSATDFTTSADNAEFLLESNRTYFNSSLSEGASSAVPLMNLASVELWTPVNGNQKCISAVGDINVKSYLAFETEESIEPVYATATASIQKQDQAGHRARGATFTVYDNAACTTVRGTMTDSGNNGLYSFSFNKNYFTEKLENDTTPVVKDFYIKETSPATQVEVSSGNWQNRTMTLTSDVYRVNISWVPSTGTATWTMYKNNTQLGNPTTVSRPANSDTTTITVGNQNVANNVVGSISIDKVYDNNERVAGAVFTVYNDANCTSVRGTITSNGTGPVSLGNLPIGANGTTYYVKETTAPTNCVIDSKVYPATLTVTTPSVTITNSIPGYTYAGKFVNERYGSVVVNKVNVEGQPVSGATFTVFEDSACTKTVGSLTDANGVYTRDKMVPGTYYLKETIAPAGYQLDTGVYAFTVTPNTATTVSNPDAWRTLGGNPANGNFYDAHLGTVMVTKTDANGEPLSGAVFTVYKADGSVAGSLNGDGRGTYTLGNLPVGSYTLKETTAPTGYENDPNEYPFEITVNSYTPVVVNVTWENLGDFASEDAFVNLSLGSITAYKVDKDGNTLTDAVFNVYADEDCETLIDVMSETEEGSGVYKLVDLASGTYYVKEVQSPIGYTIDPNVYALTIDADHRDVVCSNFTWTVLEDLGYAREGEFVNFSEIHTEATDSATGTHTSSSYEEVTLVDKVSYMNLIPGKEYTMTATIYFKDTEEPLLDADGNEVVAVKTFVPEEADGVVEVEVTVDGKLLVNQTIVFFEECDELESGRNVGFHMDIDDKPQSVQFPSCGTTLIATDNTHVAAQNSTLVLTDYVETHNLVIGEEYTINGVLMDLATGEPLLDKNGAEITGTKTFTAEESDPVIEIVFSFDSSLLANKTLVAFESVESNGKVVCFHNDLQDKNQTVQIPDLGTTFYDRDLGEEYDIASYGSVTLVDKVEYENIVPNLEYTLTGVVYVKETGEALLGADGKPVTATAKFTPTTASGSTTVTFTNVDTTNLAGMSLVAFETLSYAGTTLVVHADINDVNQTVRVPEIGTTLLDPETQTHVAYYSETVTLEDTIAYTGLQAGKQYVANGTLYDGDTGEAILNSDGTPVTSTATFTASSTGNGTAKVTFVFNTTILAAEVTKIVAFEEVKVTPANKTVAVHADINDVPQTVLIPRIGTTATVDGKHTFKPNDHITVVDTVAYSNLTPGREYRLDAQLMNADGSAFTIDNKELTATGTFTPTEAAGSTSVISFTFNGTDLKNGQKLVVFETVTDVQTGKVVAIHKDINSAGQTVTAEWAPTPPATGESASKTFYKIGEGACILGIGACMVLLLKKKKSEVDEDGIS